MRKPFQSIISLFHSSLKPPASSLHSPPSPLAPRPSSHKPAIAYICLYAFTSLIIGITTGFVVATNDFWGNLFIARHMYADMPQSLYDGNYPVGYQAVLNLGIRVFNPEAFGFVLNLLFALLLFSICYWFLRKIVAKQWALAAVILLSLYPRLFHYLNTAGADAGSVAFFAAGMLMIYVVVLKDTEIGARAYWKFVQAGILLGLAALWRYHCLVAAALLILSVFACRPKAVKGLFACGIAVLVIYSIQFGINIATGHGLLETCHEINVYNLMHTINWHRITDLTFSSSIAEVIAESPRRFAAGYAAGAIKLSVAAIPCCASLIVSSNRGRRIISAVCLVFCLMYAAMFGLSASGRAVLVLLPVSFLCSGIFMDELSARLRVMRLLPAFVSAALSVVLVAAAMAAFAYKDSRRIKHRLQAIRQYRHIELVAKELGVVSGRQVFASDFNIYFPSLEHARPMYNGGWARLATHRYNEINPEFRVDRLEEFLADCAAGGIRILALTEESRLLSPVIHSVYTHQLQDMRIKPVAQVGKYRIFLIASVRIGNAAFA